MGPEFDVFVSDKFEFLASSFSSKRAEDALRSLFPILNQDYLFVSDGTLLGILREDALISHDSDLDFGVLVKKNQVPPNSFLDLEVIRTVSWCGLPMQIAYNYNETIVDFLFYYEGYTPNFLIHCQPETLLKIPLNFVKPLKKHKFRDFEINIPNSSTDFFVWSYGEDWQVPQQSKGNWFDEYPNLFLLNEIIDFDLDLQSRKILKMAAVLEHKNIGEDSHPTENETVLMMELNEARGILRAMMTSTSWRITLPLRVVSNFIKYLRSKIG
jgi:hypothetical protein